MDDTYFHPGWTGEPYASDFMAKWGLIKLNEMYDGSRAASRSEAAEAAIKAGKVYFISPKPSKLGNRLYKARKNGLCRCVVAMLDDMRSKADTNRERYRSDINARIVQIVRAARSRARARGLPCDLDEGEIVRRVVDVGRCEVTGLSFDLRPGTWEKRRALSPSLDQIEPSGGYTMDNVRVVCWAYNMMRANFDPEDVDVLIRALKGALPDVA